MKKWRQVFGLKWPIWLNRPHHHPLPPAGEENMRAQSPLPKNDLV